MKQLIQMTVLLASLTACVTQPEPATTESTPAVAQPTPAAGQPAPASRVANQDTPRAAVRVPKQGDGTAGTVWASTEAPSFLDANRNGVDDTLDIVLGTSLDEDLNGIPDEAEQL